MEEPRVTRRVLIGGAAAVPIAVVLAGCGDDEGSDAGTTAADGRATTGPDPDTATTTLEQTPACDDGDDPTPEQTEGPYFTPDSPERTSLRESGMGGTALTLTGRVLTTDCTPVGRALLDFWQCDDTGEYDNSGFRLRGHQFTSSDGDFRLETIVPGVYPGRTRHIHVKVQPPDGPVLTTQLYFPGEPGNESDGIFDEALLVSMRGSGGRATFDFVV